MAPCLGAHRGSTPRDSAMPYKCKEKQKEYLRKYHLRRQAFVQELKRVPCTDCKLEYPHYVMDFDHVIGKKVGNINDLAQSRSIESLKEELSKCEVVCSNCHRTRTYNRAHGMVKHRGGVPVC